jgi:hypothetical protein
MHAYDDQSRHAGVLYVLMVVIAVCLRRLPLAALQRPGNAAHHRASLVLTRLNRRQKQRHRKALPEAPSVPVNTCARRG